MKSNKIFMKGQQNIEKFSSIPQYIGPPTYTAWSALISVNKIFNIRKNLYGKSFRQQ
jgi:hypothetical protein